VFLGEDFELKFVFRIDLTVVKESTRCYRSIDFESCDINDENFEIISVFLSKIGRFVKDLKMTKVRLEPGQFFQLLDLVPNIEILELSETKLKKPIENWPTKSYKFQKLKTLNMTSGFSVPRGHPKDEISNLYLHLFKDVTTLEELSLDRNFTMISQQPKLKKLTLQVAISDFDLIEQNEEVQVTDLELNLWDEKRDFGSGLQNLKNFLESQKKIEFLNIVAGTWRDNNPYEPLLRHLLTLESLRSITRAVERV
jgi:hypothetical protein